MSYTSIGQSKMLLELGLSPESADMYYKYVLSNSDKIIHNPEICSPINALEWYNKGYTISGKNALTSDEFCVPCWSLGALLEVMPKIILNKCHMYGWDLYPAAKNFRLAYIKYGNVNAPDYQEIVFYKVNEKTPLEAAIN